MTKVQSAPARNTAPRQPKLTYRGIELAPLSGKPTVSVAEIDRAVMTVFERRAAGLAQK